MSFGENKESGQSTCVGLVADICDECQANRTAETLQGMKENVFRCGVLFDICALLSAHVRVLHSLSDTLARQAG